MFTELIESVKNITLTKQTDSKEVINLLVLKTTKCIFLCRADFGLIYSVHLLFKIC